MRIEEAFSEMKRLWEEAETEHQKDDDLLSAAYKGDIQGESLVKAIEERWAEQGGRYWNGQYYKFTPDDLPKNK